MEALMTNIHQQTKQMIEKTQRISKPAYGAVIHKRKKLDNKWNEMKYI